MSLNFDAYYNEIFQYFQAHTYIAVALSAVLLLLLFSRPKVFLTLLLLVVINLSSFYLISYTSQLGKAQKSNLIQKNNVDINAN